MIISFNVCGAGFNAIDYLTELQHIPASYHLYEYEDNFSASNDRPGFALHFISNNLLTRLPFGLLRFLVANEDFLISNSYRNVFIRKELIIHTNGKHLEPLIDKDVTLQYKLSHWLLLYLAQSSVELSIMKYM